MREFRESLAKGAIGVVAAIESHITTPQYADTIYKWGPWAIGIFVSILMACNLAVDLLRKVREWRSIRAAAAADTHEPVRSDTIDDYPL